jgi:transketolase
MSDKGVLDKETVESTPTDGDTPLKRDEKKVEFSAEQQEKINFEIAKATRKAEEKAKVELEAYKENLARETREAQLLEKENFKQLAEERAAELDKLKRDLEVRELDAKTETLLANAGITDSVLRDLVKALPADLEKRAQYVEQLNDTLTKQAERIVADKLHMTAPDKSVGITQQKRIKEMTAPEKADLYDKIGKEAYARRLSEEAADSRK